MAATKRRQPIIIGGALIVLVILLAAVSLLGILVARSLLAQTRVALPAGVEPDSSGVLVVQLLPDSPAAKAGLRRGALLFSVDGLLVRDRNELNQLLAARGPGAEVTLLVLQGDEPEEVIVTLADGAPWLGAVLMGPAAAEAALAPAPPTPAVNGAAPGIGAAAAANDLPVVTRVVPNSPADRAGFRTGDVITAVGDRPVTTVSGFVALLQRLSPDEEVVVWVQRAGATESLTVALEERVGAPGEPFLGVQLPPTASPN